MIFYIPGPGGSRAVDVAPGMDQPAA